MKNIYSIYEDIKTLEDIQPIVTDTADGEDSFLEFKSLNKVNLKKEQDFGKNKSYNKISLQSLIRVLKNYCKH